MFNTAEARWFGRGDLPEGVVRWFSHFPGEPLGPYQRTDVYLHTGVDNVGIKIREGRLEIKFRNRSDGQIQFHRQVSGFIEHWAKASFEIEETGIYTDQIIQAGNEWIDVNKSRQLRLYHLTHDGSVYPATSKEPANDENNLKLATGCTVEITEIMTFQDKWWSLAFEAFGQEKGEKELLLAVVEYLANYFEPPELDAIASFSYPHWLNTS